MPAVLCALTTTAQTKCGKAKSEQRKRGGFGDRSLRLDFGHAPTLEAGARRERHVERHRHRERVRVNDGEGTTDIGERIRVARTRRVEERVEEEPRTVEGVLCSLRVEGVVIPLIVILEPAAFTQVPLPDVVADAHRRREVSVAHRYTRGNGEGVIVDDLQR